MAALKTSIREALGSNIDWDNDILTEAFRGFIIPPGKCQVSCQILSNSSCIHSHVTPRYIL
jgi:hypothetical protein